MQSILNLHKSLKRKLVILFLILGNQTMVCDSKKIIYYIVLYMDLTLWCIFIWPRLIEFIKHTEKQIRQGTKLIFITYRLVSDSTHSRKWFAVFSEIRYNSISTGRTLGYIQMYCIECRWNYHITGSVNKSRYVTSLIPSLPSPLFCILVLK